MRNISWNDAVGGTPEIYPQAVHAGSEVGRVVEHDGQREGKEMCCEFRLMTVEEKTRGLENVERAT
jgi:hypothetical protein